MTQNAERIFSQIQERSEILCAEEIIGSKLSGSSKTYKIPSKTIADGFDYIPVSDVTHFHFRGEAFQKCVILMS